MKVKNIRNNNNSGMTKFDSKITHDLQPYHTPALLAESIAALDIRPGGIYADATFGGGGHSRAIVEHLGADGHLYGFDQDIDAYANSIEDPRFTFVRSNFRYMPNFMRYYGVDRLDGIIADLGVSFHHFDAAERGFSFRSDAPLDMRMNTSSSTTAADLVNTLSEQQLREVLSVGSDLGGSLARKLVQRIVKARQENPILTTGQLTATVAPLLNPRAEKKDLSQIFQALRIRVNNELDVLIEFLQNAARILRPGGRLAVITYHSLEDRLVKSFMKSGNVSGESEQDFYGNFTTPWKIVTRSPITPSPEEIERNPRSRSAKLRVAQLK